MADQPIAPNTPFEDILNQIAIPTDRVMSNGEWSQLSDYDKFIQGANQILNVKQNPLAPDPVNPFQIDISGRFPLQALGQDNEDLYAQGQGALEQAFNGVVKGLSLVGTTFLQGTVGLVNGVFQAVSDGKFSSFYDNEFNNSLDDINKNLENQLANYYSAAERERPWYKNILTSNFIWDKIVKNLGYMGGAVLSGNVYSAALSRMLGAAKMAASGKALDALKLTEGEVKAFGSAQQAFAKYASQYNLLDKGQRAVVAGLATFGEASMEALQTTDQMRSKLVEEYRLANGKLPEGQDLENINNAAANAGNTVFGLNTLLLSASNYIQFPKLLSSSTKAEKGMFAEMARKANNVEFDAKSLKYVDTRPTSKFAKMFNKVRPYTFSGTEGLEEVSQYAAQTGAENYWYKKYEAGDEMDLNFLNGVSELFGEGSAKDLYGYGAQQAISPEGQEQFFIGGVSGAIGKARGTFKGVQRENTNRQAFLDASNKYNLSTYTKDTLDSVKRGAVLSQQLEDSIRLGDVLEHKDLERDFMVNYMFPKIKHGRMDLFYDELNTYRQLAATDEGFQQLVGEGKALPNVNRDSYLIKLSNIEQLGKQLQSSYETLNTAAAYQTVTTQDGKTVSKYSPKTIEQLIYSAAKIMDYDKRIPELATNLIIAGIDTETLVKDSSKFEEYSKLVDNLSIINGRSVTEDVRKDLRTDLADIVELSLRRDKFIKEYNDLLETPEKFESKEPQIINKLRVTTKDGEEDIEIGKEYYLGEIEKETDLGLVSKKYPKLTILGENSDGTLKIKDAGGNIKNIDKKELSGYKLGKVSDVRNNPKAKYYMDNKDRVFKYKFKGGKTEEGLIRWSPNKDELYFEYLVNGKPRRIPVSAKEFSYKIAAEKGFKEPKITATNATAQDISDADILGAAEEKLQSKLENRKTMVQGFVETSRKRLESIKEEISKNKKKLESVDESISNLTSTKAGIPRKKFTKAITKTLNDLAKIKSETLTNISDLEVEKQELEAILPYFEDLLSNIKELPENTNELIEDLSEDVSRLNELVEVTKDGVASAKSLIETVNSSLATAYSLLNDYIKRVREENQGLPTTIDEYQAGLEKYLGDEGAKQFIENNEGFTLLIKGISADISDFSDELLINVQEDKLKKLENQLKDLQSGLDDLLKEQVAKSKILEFFEEKIKEEKQKRAESEAAIKNEDLQKKIFKSQEAAQTASGINTGNFENDQAVQKQLNKEKELDSSYKKSTPILFISTTSRDEDSQPDSVAAPNIVKERDFLYNQEFFAPEIKNNLKVLTISANQEAQYNLEGLVNISAKQNTDEGWDKLSDSELKEKVTDIDNGVVLAVYTYEKNGNLFYVDEKGETIGKVGDKVDINKIVTSTLSTTSTTWRNGKSRVRSGDEALAKEISSEWRVAREKMLNGSQVFDVSFSRGLPVYNTKEGQIVLSNPEDILYPKEIKSIIESTPDVIKVMTEDTYTPYGKEESFKVTPGRVYFQYNGVFAPLINRQFNTSEQNAIYEVIIKLSEQAIADGTLKGSYLTFLQNTLFWGTPKNKPGRNQIWVSTDNGLVLNFGNSGQSIPFTPSNLQDPGNKSLLMGFLSGTYNNINNNTLNNMFNETFYEYYIDGGELKTKEHKNYQSYLLNNNLVLTPIAPKSESPNQRNFKQKYAILHGLELQPKQTAENDINVKKADIERRRQEELKGEEYRIVVSSEIWKDGEGRLYRIDKLKNGKQRLSNTNEQGNILNTIEVYEGEVSPTKFIFDGEKVRDQEVKGNKIVDVINAKYDAELAELEKTEGVDNSNIDSKIHEEALKITLDEYEGAEWASRNLTFGIAESYNGESNVLMIQDKQDPSKIFLASQVVASPNASEEFKNDIIKLQSKLQEIKDKYSVKAAAKSQEVTKPKEIKIKPNNGEEYRAVSSFVIERMSDSEKEEFKKFIKDKLPQFTPKEVEDLITMSNGKKAWGKMAGNVLEFYKKAEKGTGYHEAFEGVWKYFVTPDEKIAILNEFKNREGFFNDRVTNERISYNESSDEQAKEKIADEFAEYRLGKKQGIGGAIKGLFERIIKFFRSFLRGFRENTELRDQLFDKISEGGFKEYILPETLSTTPEYSSVRGLTEAQSNAIIQDMAKRTFTTLLRDGVDLMYTESYENLGVLAKLKQHYIDNELIEQLPEGETTYKILEKRLREYLKTFKIEFDENNEVIINDENRNKNEYADDKFLIDVKKSSPFAIKFLLASLAKTQSKTPEGNIIYNTQGAIEGMQQLIPFAKTFTKLLETFETSTSFDDSIEKLQNLAKKNLDFLPLLRMLGGKGETFDLNKLTETQWRLLLAFYNTFNLQKPKTEFLSYADDGQVFYFDAHIGRNTKALVNQWIDGIIYNARQSKGFFLPYDSREKIYKIDKEKVRKNSEAIVFLNTLGINITRSDYNSLSNTKRFGKSQQSERAYFIDQVHKIKNYISTKDGIKTLSASSLDISGPLTALAELFVKVNTTQSESTFPNSEGRQQQTFVGHNYYSTFVNKFNSVGNIEELYDVFPNLKGDTFSENSEVLKLGGVYFDSNGNRTSTKLELTYTDGIKKEERGLKIADLNNNDRLISTVNSVLSGKYNISVPADSSTEWAFVFEPFISQTTASNDELFKSKTLEILKGYLQTEMDLSKESRKQLDNVGDKSKKLRFFEDILSENTKKIIKKDGVIPQSADKEILDFIDNIKVTLRNNLKTVGELVPAGADRYAIPKLLTSYGNNSMNEKELNSLLNFVVVNTFIANTEIHKLLFGDPYNFAIKKDGSLDETKRIKSFGSPAKPTMTSNYYNSSFLQNFNKNIKDPKTLGYYVPKDYVNTTTYSDILVDSEYVGYAGVNEADAGAIHSIFMHRDLMNRQGKWGKNEEDWFQWEMAYTRQKLQGRVEFSYPSELQKADKELLKTKKPTYTLSVIKPIVRGVKQDSSFTDIVLDKFSSTPLFFSGVEGRNLEKLFTKMWKENVDYVIFESGRKVGSQGKNSFYTKEGKFNEEPFKGKFKINWNDYYIQVETTYEEGKKQTRGSQITKLFSIDFMDSGKPLDYQGDDWSSLSEEEKVQKSEIYKEIKYNNQLLSEMTTLGYTSLIDRLGIQDTGSNFVIYDYTKLYKTLQDEALKREMPENLKKIFLINPETNQPYYPLEASAKYDEIQKMLYSMVDKSIVAPKVNGGPHTQIPATGWEIEERKVNGKSVLTSSSLKFYTKEDPYMEILIPYWFKPKNKSEAEILEYLNNSEEGKRILKAIGFRIPTQGMGAIEAIRIKGFLPKEFGSTVVVPSEITTKAGSDFDIDKLNMYLKNVYVTRKGDIKLYKFENPKSEAEFKDFYETFLLERYKKFKEKEKIVAVQLSADQLFENLDFESDSDEILFNLEKNHVPSIEEFLMEAPSLSTLEFNKKFLPGFKKALENEYFESIERMVTNPLNFDRLVQPTENKTLPDLAKEVAAIRNTTESKKLSSLLDFNYLNNLRHAFLIAKKWVGIGAVNITGHSQAQRTNIYIDVANTELSEKDREILKDGSIQLPHNVDENNKPTMSKRKDTADKFISDKISWYLTAFVDVAKDPYILQLIYSKKIVGTFMFLERVGVPTDVVSYFMNQPIIREYIQFSDIQGFSSLANPYWRDKFLESAGYGDRKADRVNIESLKDQLSRPSNPQQLTILDEFLKYFKMAEHNFKFNQATNWDTTRFTSGSAIRKKELLLSNQLKSNIFKSPVNILQNSNNGRIQEAVILSKQALESLSKLNSLEIQGELNRVLDPYLQLTYSSADLIENLDIQILKSFVDFLVQKKAGAKLNPSEVPGILEELRNIDKSKYNNNPLFDIIKIKPNGDVYLQPFPKTTYDKNLVTSYFEELRELSTDSEGVIKKGSIYSKLIKLGLLQGTGDYYSILSYIPVDDIAKILNLTPTKEDAKLFADLHLFEKNNWKDDEIVPYLQKIHPANFPTSAGPKILVLSETYNSSTIERPVLKLDKYTKTHKKGTADRVDLLAKPSSKGLVNISFQDTIKPMIDKKDFSFVEKVGYVKVLQPNGEPFTTIGQNGEKLYYYRQMNLLGTRNIKEHPVTEKPTVLDNMAAKVKNTISDDEVIRIVTGKTFKQKDSFDEFKQELETKNCD